jgi:hypothetical protein
MLLTTKVGGVGLTLTGADRVVTFSPNWNPCVDAQAVGRAYRISQTRKVKVYRLLLACSIEEKIYWKQVHKEGMIREVFTNATDLQRCFTKAELAELFTLAPPQSGQTKHKPEFQASVVKATDRRGDAFVLDHPAVVGLLYHGGVYGKARSSTFDSAAVAASCGKKRSADAMLEEHEAVVVV